MVRWKAVLSLAVSLACTWALPARATEYYVSNAATDGYAVGNNSNSCVQAQNKATPKLTIMGGEACMAGGDTVTVNAGTYVEEIINPPSGTDAAYTIVRADPTVTMPLITPDGALPNAKRGLFLSQGSTNHHIELRGFEVDGAYNFAKLDGNDTIGYAHHIRIVGNKMHDSHSTGLLIAFSPTGFLGGNHYIAGNEFYHTGIFTPVSPGGHNTIYGLGSETIVERNYFHNLQAGVGDWASGKSSRNNIIRYNRFYQIGRTDIDPYLDQVENTLFAAIHISVPGGNKQIYGNVVYDSFTTGANARGIYIFAANSTDVNHVYNNTIYNNQSAGSKAIELKAGKPGTHNFKNNIAYLAGAGIVGGTQSNNQTTNPSFVSAGTGDLSLALGSTAINAGVNVGLPYNGTNPDIGAHEFHTFTSGSCVGQTCDIQIDMNTFTPFQLGNSLGWSLDASRTVTNVALVGSSIARLTYTGTCTGGNASYDDATGTATDSALIGNTKNQSLRDTGPIALINSCGSVAYTFTQTAGAIYSGLGAQTTTAQIHQVSPGGMAAVRTKFKATGAAPPAITSKLQYATDGENGTFADLPDAFAAGNIRYVGLGNLPGMDTHGMATTERLASEFTGMVTGGVLRCFIGCETPAVLLTQDSESEQVDIVEFDTDAAVDTVYWFRRVQSDDTVMTYAANSKPSITIKPPSASGFASLPEQPWGLTVSPDPIRARWSFTGHLGDAQKNSWFFGLPAGNGLKLDEPLKIGGKARYSIR